MTGLSWWLAGVIVDAGVFWGGIGMLPEPLPGAFRDALLALARWRAADDVFSEAGALAFMVAWAGVFAVMFLSAAAFYIAYRLASAKSSTPRDAIRSDSNA
jgi:hypothetical protein